MAIYQGTYFTQLFVVKTKDGPVDISGWEFEAQFRKRVDDADSLLDLTTAGGAFSLTDAVNGELQLAITEDLTATLPLGRVVFDVLRTDASPGPRFVFRAAALVKQSATRT